MPAEAIVFLHGNLSRGSHWQPQLDALAAEGWRVHAPNQRGFGDPPAPGRPDSLLDLADDVSAWCAAERLDAVSIAGMSFGGSVAQTIAVRHPEIVHSLLLAGTYRLDALHPAIAAFNAPAIEHGVPRIDTIEPMVRASFSDRYQATHPEVVDRIVDELLATEQATLDATLTALEDFPKVVAPTISAPTIVVGGRDDGLCPLDASRALADAIPGARFVELETGHLSNIEAPTEFTKLVRDLASG
jgi:pimeloyl-ACP methyl ester carboxylesterase